MNKIFSSKIYQKIRVVLIRHKIVSVVVIMVIVGGGYYTYNKLTSSSGDTTYTIAYAETGTIASSISGSGQVSSSDEVTVKADVSGDITWVGVKAGDTVYTGQALAAIDNTDAKTEVADAEASLAQSKLQYQKDEASAPVDYQNLLNDLEDSKSDLEAEYVDTYNTISDTYLDLPDVVTEMQNVLYSYDLSEKHTQWNVNVLLNKFASDVTLSKVQSFADSAESDYKTARTAYDASLLKYKKISRTSSETTLEDFLDESIDTTTAISQAIQSELNFLSTVIDVADQYDITLPSGVTSMQTSARSSLSTVNTTLNSLITQRKSLATLKSTIKSTEQEISLYKVGNETGDDPLSLQISKSSLEKQERELADLKEALYDYTVCSPIAGTVSSVSAKVGDSAGTVATVISNDQIAELSLSEVDVASIKVGQKATLTFDAVEDLTLTGSIIEVDSVGTVSSGVVSYTVKIAFDTQDSQIKPGMTVNATILTETKTDVLTVPSSAVKTKSGVSYVQVFSPAITTTTGSSKVTSATAPTQVTVTTGLSDDNNIEILSGIEAGTQVVVKTSTTAGTNTTTTTTGTKTTSATSILGGSTGGPPSGGPGM